MGVFTQESTYPILSVDATRYFFDSPEAFVILRPEGTIGFLNQAAAELFQVDSEILFARPFSRLISESDAGHTEFLWIRDMVMKYGFLRGHEFSYRSPRGAILRIEFSASRIYAPSGDTLGMVLLLRDISGFAQAVTSLKQGLEDRDSALSDKTAELTDKLNKLRAANVELLKLDQNRSEFVSLVSHQIRAPLTNMAAALQRLQGGEPPSPDSRVRLINILNEQVSRLDRLVRDVLNLQSFESDSLTFHSEPMSVLPVIRAAIEQFQARNVARSFESSEKPGLPLILADRDRVMDVLMNLIDNADKYSPLGDDIVLRVRASETEVTVTIEDDGPGIPEEDLEHVFEKFFRVDSSDAQTSYGYGIGLHVCRILIEGQGGRIWAERRRAGGTAVSFTLPVWQEHNVQI